MAIRIASWNVNGIRAVHKNGFMNWLNAANFDIVALQEVRAEEGQIPEEVRGHCDYKGCWYAATAKKGYSGVGILSRVIPLSVVSGMGIEEFDREGRTLCAEFKNLRVVSAYFPNSQDAGARIDYKVRFCQAIHKYVDALRTKGKPVVLTGDFNIAHTEIDLARPKENENTAGYLPQERAWMSEFLKAGWVDTFRHLHPEARERYSWWSMRTRARERNIGWRIDYHTVHGRDVERIKGADIHEKVVGSDHCPVSLELDTEI